MFGKHIEKFDCFDKYIHFAPIVFSFVFFSPEIFGIERYNLQCSKTITRSLISEGVGQSMADCQPGQSNSDSI